MNRERLDNSRWHQRVIRRLVSTPTFAWLGARFMHHIDRAVYWLSGGRATGAALLTGLPTVILTTVGAKSGLPRTTPLLGIPAGDAIVLIGSNWGQARHPAWVYNLRANPQAQLTINGQTGAYLAREVSGAERDAYWQQAVALYPGYAAYSKRTGGREIPVMVLTRTDVDSKAQRTGEP